MKQFPRSGWRAAAAGGGAASRRLVGVALAVSLSLAGCASASTGSRSTAASSPGASSLGASSPALAGVMATTAPSATSGRPAWFDLAMTDVRTGQTFTINDFAGKVVLVETMAIWCPTCRHQGDEVARLHELLGNPSDLVSVSLDISMEEDAAMLKDYAQTLGYDWNIAVAPLLVARALGNLYSAEYLNPPASPMLVIGRDGQVSGLPYGLKTAESLQGVVAPLLGP